MIAIDTNIILRFLTRQPKAHFEAARDLFRQGDLLVSVPVVMEAYFTLTGTVLGFDADHALNALEAVLHLPGVTVQDDTLVFAAIGYARQGMPFKDACVFAFSGRADGRVTALATFDRPFIKNAARLGLLPSVRLP